MNIFKAFKTNITYFIKQHFNKVTVNTNSNLESKDNAISKPEFIEPIFNYHNLNYDGIMKNFIFENSDEFSNFHENSDYTIVPEQFEKLYKDTVLYDENIPEEQIKILNKFWLDTYFIYKALEPLQKLEIPFSLDLVGGSVRDFLLNKEIKDLDICVYIDMDSLLKNRGIYFVENKDKVKLFDDIKKHFTDDELLAVNLTDNGISIEDITKVVLMCMKRTQDLTSTQLFTQSDRFIPKPDSNYGPEMINHLSALIKMGIKHTHYPIDLLVTDNMRYSVIEKVDFNICKVGLCLVNEPDALSERAYFPTTVASLTKRIYSDSTFWLDAYNKKITLDLLRKKTDQIIFSLEERLPKITNKYPEYEARINNPSDGLYQEAQTILFHSQLNEKIGEDSAPKTNIKRKKI